MPTAPFHLMSNLRMTGALLYALCITLWLAQRQVSRHGKCGVSLHMNLDLMCAGFEENSGSLLY